MKQHIALGSILLLTLGTAVAGTFLYGQDVSAHKVTGYETPVHVTTAIQEVTPEMISAWKETALATDYMPPKVPI